MAILSTVFKMASFALCDEKDSFETLYMLMQLFYPVPYVVMKLTLIRKNVSAIYVGLVGLFLEGRKFQG